jgi:anti-sigma B factor antagonist
MELVMNWSRTDDGGTTTFRLIGSLDAVTTSELRPVVDALVAEKRPKIIVDASGLRLIDSSGVGLIVSLFKRCKAAGGHVTVAGLKDQPLSIFKLLRLDKVLTA